MKDGFEDLTQNQRSATNNANTNWHLTFYDCFWVKKMNASYLLTPSVCYSGALTHTMTHAGIRWTALVTQCVNASIEIHWVTSAAHPISSQRVWMHHNNQCLITSKWVEWHFTLTFIQSQEMLVFRCLIRDHLSVSFWFIDFGWRRCRLPWQRVDRVGWSTGSIRWRHSAVVRHWSDVRHWSLAGGLSTQSHQPFLSTWRIVVKPMTTTMIMIITKHS